MTREEKLDQIRKCNHVFVRIEDGEFVGSIYRESVNECILCGTTNKNKYQELHSWSTYGEELSPEYHYYLHELDSKAYLYPCAGRRVINTNYPYLLYQAALKAGLAPDVDGTDETNNIIADVLDKLANIIKERYLDISKEDSLEELFYYYNLSKEYKKEIR